MQNREVAKYLTETKAHTVAQSMVGKNGVTGYVTRKSFYRRQFMGYVVVLQKGVMDYPLLEN